MKKSFLKFLTLAFTTIWVVSFLINPADKAFAGGASISISPSSKFFQLSPSSTYDEILNVKNNGTEAVDFEVYTAPYSYTYSEEMQSYVLGFSKENDHTKIAHWISIKDKDGNFTSRPVFTAEPGETVSVTYRITTPSSIPDGGQYAVLFAHTISNSTGGGIRSEASPGMIIYGRSSKGLVFSSEISDLNISQTIEKEVDAEENGKKTKKNATLEHINASAKVKNTGNVDFNATGVLRVTGILGIVHYETPEKESNTFIIPEAELEITDEWEGTPIFGIYNVTWTVTVGNNTETTKMTVFIMTPTAIIISIILLTLIIVCIIVIIKKRKAPLY